MKAMLGPLQPADTRQGEAWSSDFPGSPQVPTGHDRYQNTDADYRSICQITWLGPI